MSEQPIWICTDWKIDWAAVAAAVALFAIIVDIIRRWRKARFRGRLAAVALLPELSEINFRLANIHAGIRQFLLKRHPNTDDLAKIRDQISKAELSYSLRRGGERMTCKAKLRSSRWLQSRISFS